MVLAQKTSDKIGGADRIHYNQTLQTITGDPAAPRMLPDTGVVVVKGSKLNLGEVTSPSQRIADQANKYRAIIGKTFVDAKSGQKLTVDLVIQLLDRLR